MKEKFKSKRMNTGMYYLGLEKILNILDWKRYKSCRV